jgi:hypothetical protein
MKKSAELRALIDATSNEEKACQAFLPEIASHLVPFRIAPNHILMTGREESCRTGDSDFSVSVEVDNGALGRRYAYVWEVKAPQKYLFQPDSAANRLRPSDDLYSAENQLLNYVAELSESKNFKTKFGLNGLTDEVRPGGIIIGRKDRFVKCNATQEDEYRQLARFAFTTRDAYLWSPANIRIYTWDWVCSQLEDQERAGSSPGSLQNGGSQVTHPAAPSAPVTTATLLTFANELLLYAEEAFWRSAVTSAYSAVELKLFPGGWTGRGLTPSELFRKRVSRPDAALMFRRLLEIRNRSAHLFNTPLSRSDAEYAVRAATEICALLDEMDGTDGLPA